MAGLDDEVCTGTEVVERDGAGIGTGNGAECDPAPGDGGFPRDGNDTGLFH